MVLKEGKNETLNNGMSFILFIIQNKSILKSQCHQKKKKKKNPKNDEITIVPLPT